MMKSRRSEEQISQDSTEVQAGDVLVINHKHETHGHTELEEMEKSYINAGGGSIMEGATDSHRLTVFPHWPPYVVEPPSTIDGNGGSDMPLMEDIFGDGKKKNPYKRVVDHMKERSPS